jgi:hypothetical protein
MTTWEGINKAQTAARHYANMLEAESKKRVGKKRSEKDKARMKAKAEEYDEAASILLDVVNNWDEYVND